MEYRKMKTIILLLRLFILVAISFILAKMAFASEDDISSRLTVDGATLNNQSLTYTADENDKELVINGTGNTVVDIVGDYGIDSNHGNVNITNSNINMTAGKNGISAIAKSEVNVIGNDYNVLNMQDERGWQGSMAIFAGSNAHVNIKNMDIFIDNFGYGISTNNYGNILIEGKEDRNSIVFTNIAKKGVINISTYGNVKIKNMDIYVEKTI
jgi:hypothetical protein